MTPAQRCDEIIKMIDEVLGVEAPGDLPGPPDERPLDGHFPAARPAPLP
jgi:hypothetical protein